MSNLKALDKLEIGDIVYCVTSKDDKAIESTLKVTDVIYDEHNEIIRIITTDPDIRLRQVDQHGQHILYKGTKSISDNNETIFFFTDPIDSARFQESFNLNYVAQTKERIDTIREKVHNIDQDGVSRIKQLLTIEYLK